MPTIPKSEDKARPAKKRQSKLTRAELNARIADACVQDMNDPEYLANKVIWESNDSQRFT